MVTIRGNSFAINPSHEPGLHHRGTEARRNKTDRLYLCAGVSVVNLSPVHGP